MNYFKIRNSSDKKILGHYPQVKENIYNCHVWDEPKFVEHIELKTIDFEPIMANAVLNNKSKVTDLISTTGMGFTRKLLVSIKLKKVIENYKKSNFEFFKSPIIHNKKIIDDYFVLVPFNVSMSCINFKESEIFFKEGLFDIIEKLNITSIDEYEIEKSKIEKKGYPYNIYIDKIIFEENIEEHFLIINNIEGGIQYIVSEHLKKEIEDAGCTGIEFQPSELSLSEWLHGGEREKVYGKA